MEHHTGEGIAIFYHCSLRGQIHTKFSSNSVYVRACMCARVYVSVRVRVCVCVYSLWFCTRL